MKKHLLLFLAFLALVFSAGAQATIILEAHDVWDDGTGYQLLLDADHNTYGSIIPTSGALTNGGDVPSSVYDEFEYTVPVGADGSLTTTNIVFDGTATITIPAGTYDFCITNPTPGDRMWIASEAADPTRADDYVFEDNTIYHFTMAKTSDGHDCTHLEITFVPLRESRQPHQLLSPFLTTITVSALPQCFLPTVARSTYSIPPLPQELKMDMSSFPAQVLMTTLFL